MGREQKGGRKGVPASFARPEFRSLLTGTLATQATRQTEFCFSPI